jgi:hypothetical protein
MKTLIDKSSMKQFSSSEIVIPIIALVIYASLVTPTPVFGAMIVLIVSHVVVRGIRNSRRS